MKAETTTKGLEIARIHRRVIAYLINLCFFILVGNILNYFYGTPTEDLLEIKLEGLAGIALFSFGIILWPISEGLTGKTIGKWVMNLEVVSHDSEAITMGQAFIRFFLGFIDYIFLIGVLIAANDKECKRIGDIVAKTIVVKSKK